MIALGTTVVHEVHRLDLALMLAITTCGRRYRLESDQVQDGHWTEAWLKRKHIALPLCCQCQYLYGHGPIR